VEFLLVDVLPGDVIGLIAVESLGWYSPSACCCGRDFIC
jgi:hypothetical protein